MGTRSTTNDHHYNHHGVGTNWLPWGGHRDSNSTYIQIVYIPRINVRAYTNYLSHLLLTPNVSHSDSFCERICSQLYNNISTHGAQDACASWAPVCFLFFYYSITNDVYRTGTGTGSTSNSHHYHHHGAQDAYASQVLVCFLPFPWCTHLHLGMSTTMIATFKLTITIITSTSTGYTF